MRTFVEECVQDVFAKALVNYDKLQNHPDLAGWFFRACFNRMCNIEHVYYHRGKRHAYSVDANPDTELFDPTNMFQELEERDDYLECLKRLNELLLENEKQIFDDYFVHHISLDEVAKRSGRTKSSVKSVIYRIRQRLDKKYTPPLIIFLVLGASFQILNNLIRRGR